MPPDIDQLPARVSVREAARLVTLYYFPVAYRSLETWGLSKVKVNGKNTVTPKELFAKAQARLDAAKEAA